MANFHGSVKAGGTGWAVARIADEQGIYLLQADISAITYTIYDSSVGSCPGTAVTGHIDATIDVADAIFDTLQLDAMWTSKSSDGIGYNFRHIFDRETNEPFPDCDTTYNIEIKITPVDGQLIIVCGDAKT